jgi:hypothetical protein
MEFYGFWPSPVLASKPVRMLPHLHLLRYRVFGLSTSYSAAIVNTVELKTFWTFTCGSFVPPGQFPAFHGCFPVSLKVLLGFTALLLNRFLASSPATFGFACALLRFFVGSGFSPFFPKSVRLVQILSASFLAFGF